MYLFNFLPNISLFKKKFYSVVHIVPTYIPTTYIYILYNYYSIVRIFSLRIYILMDIFVINGLYTILMICV